MFNAEGLKKTTTMKGNLGLPDTKPSDSSAVHHHKHKAHKVTQLFAPSLQADRGSDFKADEE